MRAAKLFNSKLIKTFATFLNSHVEPFQHRPGVNVTIVSFDENRGVVHCGYRVAPWPQRDAVAALSSFQVLPLASLSLWDRNVLIPQPLKHHATHFTPELQYHTQHNVRLETREHAKHLFSCSCAAADNLLIDTKTL